MTREDARANLRNLLADLYPDELSARRVVADASLNEQHIAFSGTAINTWHAILREAENTGKTEALFRVVLKEYKTHPTLRSTIDAYQRQVQSQSEASTEPVSRSARSGEDSMIKILFLAANPTDTTRLRLDEESRSIYQALRQAEYRDRFDIRQLFAVRVVDLQGHLLHHQPNIVHFSGHGSDASEIILEDNAGQSHPVSPRALSTVFSLLKDNIRCVVLTACYSEKQAQAIAEHIDCVVGMSEAIGDRAAISFATSFYQALGYGRNVKTAFDLGRAQIDLENIPEEHIPKLLATKVDPAQVVLVSSISNVQKETETEPENQSVKLEPQRGEHEEETRPPSTSSQQGSPTPTDATSSTETPSPDVPKKTERLLAYIFGVAFIVVILVLAVFFPEPTPFQYFAFRTVLALAAAGVGAVLPGLINVDISHQTQIAQVSIRAAGAIALFIVVYFFSPAGLVVEPILTPSPTLNVSQLVQKSFLTDAEVARIDDFLNDPSAPEEQKWVILSELGKTGWRNVIPVLQNVIETSNDTTSKITATSALGRIGRPAQSVLLQLLGHPDSIVRTESLRSLRAVVNLPLSDQIMREVRSVLQNDPEPLVRSVAVEVLGMFNAFMAVDEIIFKLKSDEPIVRTQAARTLVIFGNIPQVRPALRSTAQHDPDENPSVAAITSLVTLQDREAIPIFDQLRSHSREVVRKAAEEAYFRSQAWATADASSTGPAATPTLTPTPTITLREGATGRASETLVVYLAPDEAEIDEYSPGTIVAFVAPNSSGEWAYVTLPNDENGWILASAINWEQEQPTAGRVKSKLWANGSTITIVFLDGNPDLKQRVMDDGQEWTQYANLTFRFIADPTPTQVRESDVRITFEQPGAWSYVGVDALIISEDQPTMSLGLLTSLSDDAQIRRTVLGQFGHMLGLLNEMNNPNHDIPWDEPALFEYYEKMGQPLGTVRRQVLNTWDLATFPVNKAFDRESVMMDDVPNDVTIGDYEIGINLTLSAGDKEFIAKLYPKRLPAPTATPSAETESIADLAQEEPLLSLAKAVGELAIAEGAAAPLRALCTAFVLSDEYILTASYCASYGARQDVRLVLRLGYWSEDSTPREYALDREPVELDEELGYAVLRVAEGAPASDFAAIPLNSRAPVLNEAVVIVQHHEGKPLAVSRKDCSVTKYPERSPDVLVLYHTCDRGGGSGGAPILAADDLSLLGLHFASSARTEIFVAKRMDAIIAQSELLQSLTGS